MKLSHSLKFVGAIVALLSLLPGCASEQSFPSSDEAVTSLVSALRTDDEARLQKILGHDADEVLKSGDPVADQDRIHKFLELYDQKHSYVQKPNGSVVLTVGNADWPMPIPVVKNPFGNDWHFDVKSGKSEMLNRRIGQNELDTIQTCLAVVDAQRDYSAMDPENLGKPIYAQKFLSDAGKKNGLYWESKPGEPASPLGELFAEASSDGYTFTAGHPTPFHGYYYKILKSQGSSAPGGVKNYVVDGKMTAGFAVIAYPADYGNSGIMTFMVNQRGILYACNLGKNTEKVAAEIDSFDPVPEDWTPVSDANAIAD